MKYFFLFVFLLYSFTASTQNAGELDVTFGDGGIKICPFPTGDMYALPDGKILISSTSMMRLNSDGTIDSSFGFLGATLPPGGSFDVFPDGRIATADMYPEEPNGPSKVMKVTMLLANGIIDSSYGEYGVAKLVLPKEAAIGDILCLPDGSIFVCANHFTTNWPNDYLAEFFVAKFSAEGELGMPWVPYWNPQPVDFPGNFYCNFNTSGGLALQPDGKVVLCGFLSGYDGTNYITYRRVFLHRFLPDGSPDTTFGENGDKIDLVGGESWANDVWVSPDNFIYITGISESKLGIVVKYKLDGSRSTSFGVQGVATLPVLVGRFLLQQPDGKILVTGIQKAPLPDFQVGRIKTNGALDNSFAGDGILSIPYDPNTSYTPNAMIWLPSGKILLSARTIAPGGMLARVNSGLVVAAEEPYATHVQQALMTPNQITDQVQVNIQYNIMEKIDPYAVIVNTDGRMIPAVVEANGGGNSLTAQIPSGLHTGIYHLLFMDGAVPVRSTFVKVR